jgi:hypothetical protein
MLTTALNNNRSSRLVRHCAAAAVTTPANLKCYCSRKRGRRCIRCVQQCRGLAALGDLYAQESELRILARVNPH